MKNELKNQRNKDLIAVMQRIRSEKGINFNYISRDALIDIIMEQPAPRFYLEPRTIEHILMRHFKNLPTRNKARTEDLYEAFCRVRQKNPYMPMSEIWYLVSLQPAKSFYISPTRIREIIFNFRNILCQ